MYQNSGSSSFSYYFLKQSLDFHKPGLCHGCTIKLNYDTPPCLSLSLLIKINLCTQQNYIFSTDLVNIHWQGAVPCGRPHVWTALYDRKFPPQPLLTSNGRVCFLVDYLIEQTFSHLFTSWTNRSSLFTDYFLSTDDVYAARQRRIFQRAGRKHSAIE